MINVDSGLNKAAEAEKQIQSTTQSLDKADTKGMLELQQEMNKMGVLYGTLSAVIAKESHVFEGIIQKM